MKMFNWLKVSRGVAMCVPAHFLSIGVSFGLSRCLLACVNVHMQMHVDIARLM